MPTPSPSTAKPYPGHVALVGAGPGDPGLITVRGAEKLRTATHVVYDALSSPRLLDLAPDAEHLYVGKRASHHARTQDQINALLVELGTAGNQVVRLKGGDPFVFGRGGEECEALRAAGVSFEVVPGITAAIAAAAYAGIPVTHRDLNSGFTLVTGHEKERKYQDDETKRRQDADPAGSSDLDYAALAKLPGLCFYMGVKALPRIAERLIDAGMDPQTPAATVQWGTTPRQRTVTATLATIADAVAREGIGAPAITYVGPTVELRNELRWFDTRPLFGQTVLITRTRDQASNLRAKLEAEGAAVAEAPTIRTESNLSPEVLRRLEGMGSFGWTIFTSGNAVRAFREAMTTAQRNWDARRLGRCRIAAVGPATAAALWDELRLLADLVGSGTATDLADDLAADEDGIEGQSFLLPRADIAGEGLPKRLLDGGALEVLDLPLYRTLPVEALPADVVADLDA
ncbi:MAG: uroporphyrinogen-III C-methyltransferase, partial [Planctomycetota bacterium]